MLGRRPSSFTAPSIWYAAVATPHRKRWVDMIEPAGGATVSASACAEGESLEEACAIPSALEGVMIGTGSNQRLNSNTARGFVHRDIPARVERGCEEVAIAVGGAIGEDSGEPPRLSGAGKGGKGGWALGAGG